MVFRNSILDENSPTVAENAWCRRPHSAIQLTPYWDTCRARVNHAPKVPYGSVLVTGGGTLANLMRAVIVLWLGFAVGCEEDSGVQAKGVSSGKKRDAGQVEPDAGGLEGADASEPMGDPGAPEVRLLTPQSASDPNTDEVVTEASVGVRCRVSAGDAQLDPDSIRIEFLDEAGEAQEVPEVESLSDEEFLARFQLAERPNGPLSFRCSASDVDGREGWDEVDTFLDLGPSCRCYRRRTTAA